MSDYQAAAKACRQAAKFFEGFKAGEEIATWMDQAEHALGNTRAELARVTQELDAARSGLTQATHQAHAIVRDAEATAQASRESASRDVAAARTKLEQDTRVATAGIHAQQQEQNSTLAARHQALKEEEIAIAKRRQALVEEEARMSRVRDKAKQALAALGS